MANNGIEMIDNLNLTGIEESESKTVRLSGIADEIRRAIGRAKNPHDLAEALEKRLVLTKSDLLKLLEACGIVKERQK